MDKDRCNTAVGMSNSDSEEHVFPLVSVKSSAQILGDAVVYHLGEEVKLLNPSTVMCGSEKALVDPVTELALSDINCLPEHVENLCYTEEDRKENVLDASPSYSPLPSPMAILNDLKERNAENVEKEKDMFTHAHTGTTTEKNDLIFQVETVTTACTPDSKSPRNIHASNLDTDLVVNIDENKMHIKQGIPTFNKSFQEKVGLMETDECFENVTIRKQSKQTLSCLQKTKQFINVQDNFDENANNCIIIETVPEECSPTEVRRQKSPTVNFPDNNKKQVANERSHLRQPLIDVGINTSLLSRNDESSAPKNPVANLAKELKENGSTVICISKVITEKSKNINKLPSSPTDWEQVNPVGKKIDENVEQMENLSPTTHGSIQESKKIVGSMSRNSQRGLKSLQLHDADNPNQVSVSL